MHGLGQYWSVLLAMARVFYLLIYMPLQLYLRNTVTVMVRDKNAMHKPNYPVLLFKTEISTQVDQPARPQGHKDDCKTKQS